MMRCLAVPLGCLLFAACSPNPPPTQPPPDGGSVITDGGPNLPACSGSGYARCDGTCVNTRAEARHCGACGNACVEGANCVDGSCQCPSGRVACSDACVDLKVDAENCGQCGAACPFGSACLSGQCVVQCGTGQAKCGEVCVNLQDDAANCGACGTTCSAGTTCIGGMCRCPAEQTSCNGVCADLQSDPSHCGNCNTQCFGGFSCTAGTCTCDPSRVACGTACVDIKNDPQNCGGCNLYCQSGQSCVNGACDTPCPAGFTRCGNQCVDTQTNGFHCGACGTSCGALSCQGGQCQTCNSATTDCDNDGWTVADGDCCDQPGACGPNPAAVNPGALELVGNGIDDNCNALVDTQDGPDTQPCDTGLSSNSTNATDFAKAMGICRTTTESPPPAQKAWGLIEAKLLKADGSALTYPGAHSLRPAFGSALQPVEGRTLVVLSSGIAADGSQQNPGPNGGPSSTSVDQGSSVDIQNCTQPGCIQDWFNAGNPPLKNAQQLPEAPGCGIGGFGGNTANDSVMLVLRMRAPTNVRAFSFNGYFLSSEYPEFVCSTFNDQLVALVDTPSGTPVGAVNPVDKNLMTYSNGGQQWPVGINVARGTSLFKVCESKTANPTCWDPDVSTSSCQKGIAELSGTGFETGGFSTCTNGGGTGWLTTSGNVVPGEIVELRIAIWDVGDHILDSLALLDGFKWLQQPAQPGTTD